MVVLIGLRGIGKTHLAQKTALNFYKNYSYTAWFDAKESLEEQFLEFAEEYHIYLNSSKSEGKIKQIKKS